MIRPILAPLSTGIVCSLWTLAAAQTPPPASSSSTVPPRGAATFNVTPTQIDLVRPGASASLLLRNESPDTLRFRVTSYRWTNNANGEMVLDDTTDVVFFPAMFTIAAGQTRRLRVATTALAKEQELAYRLVLEQLPSEAESGDNGIRMLTKLNVPVFVLPPKRTLTTTLDGLGVADGHVVFDLRNTGTVHVRFGEILVQERSTTGVINGEHKLVGWYVLPGETRRYRVPVTADACRALGWVSVRATVAQQTPEARLEERARVDTAACGAP